MITNLNLTFEELIVHPKIKSFIKTMHRSVSKTHSRKRISTILSREEIQQAAYLGIWASLKKYDPKKGNQIHYTASFIKGYIWHELVKKVIYNSKFQTLGDETTEFLVDFRPKYKHVEFNFRDLLEYDISEEEYKLLESRFVELKSLEEIGLDLKITVEWVRQKINKLLNKLYEQMV